MTKADDAFQTPPLGATNGNPEGIGFFDLVAEDFRMHKRDVASPGFWALFWHRFGNARMSVRSKLLRAPMTLLYRVMYRASHFLGGIDLPYTVKVGRRVTLEHFGGMILVARSIGDDVIIRQNTTFGVRTTQDLMAKPVIGDRVDIGAGAVLIGGIAIGDDAVIGANAVVAIDVPPGALAVGVPAVIKQRRQKPASDRDDLEAGEVERIRVCELGQADGSER